MTAPTLIFDKVAASRQLHDDTIALTLVDTGSLGRMGALAGSASVYMPLAHPVIKHLAPGELYSDGHTVALTASSAQALVDALWEAGMRPTVAQETRRVDVGQVAAMQAHIDDLRHFAGISRNADQPAGPDPIF